MDRIIESDCRMIKKIIQLMFEFKEQIGVDL